MEQRKRMKSLQMRKKKTAKEKKVFINWFIIKVFCCSNQYHMLLLIVLS